MNARFLLIPAVLLVPFSMSVDAAGTVSGQLGIQIIIGAGCTVNNGSSNGSTNNFGSINFGQHPTLDSTLDAQSVGASAGSSFGINCAVATNYTVALNSGLNVGASNQRRMANGANYVNYNLYSDSARGTPWGNGSNGGNAVTGVGTGVTQEMVVYGRVPNQTTPAVGTYVDTVQVTITF